MADHVPAPPPLEGVRIVELAGGVAGPFAGRILADVGADVVKVEPPGGDPARREGPFPGDVPDPERSGAFLYLNTNKRALVARHDLEGDRALLAAMLDAADLVIEGEAPATLAAWGFDDGEVRRRWPRLCRLSVTGFGLDGPYAGLRSSEIVAYAMGGPMHTTGMPGREPHRMAGNVIQMQCGNMAALAGLAALEVAGRSGDGVRVDVANFETQAGSIDRRLPYLVWHRFTGERIGRQGGHRAGLIPAGVYPAEDGYVQVLAAPGWLRRLADLLGDEEADPAVVFLPYLSGERTPHDDPLAKGVFFGLTHSTTRADLGRAVLEGVALAFADGADALRQAGTRIGRVSLVGGGARSPLWSRILASALGLELGHSPGAEVGPAFGAARLARLAAGRESPAEVCTPLPVDRVFRPEPELVERCARRRPLFRGLYGDLRGRFAQL